MLRGLDLGYDIRGWWHSLPPSTKSYWPVAALHLALILAGTILPLVNLILLFPLWILLGVVQAVWLVRFAHVREINRHTKVTRLATNAAFSQVIYGSLLRGGMFLVGIGLTLGGLLATVLLQVADLVVAQAISVIALLVAVPLLNASRIERMWVGWIWILSGIGTVIAVGFVPAVIAGIVALVVGL
ncbi:MAG: hypothetical protein GYB64_02785 [Chloroflexi bacterium]|nr:hypothetical protein [Chloroflexota bacterium]